MLRLNMAIPPATTSSTLPSNLGLLGGDLAGFPNGRRVFDDVVTIEFQAIAGATLGLVDPSFTADAAARRVNQGLTSSGTDLTAMGRRTTCRSFPYLGVPHSGYFTPVELIDAPRHGDAGRGRRTARRHITGVSRRSARTRRSGEGTGPSTGASVMLDIGGDTGALVVYAASPLLGQEIEIEDPRWYLGGRAYGGARPPYR